LFDFTVYIICIVLFFLTRKSENEPKESFKFNR